MKFHISFMKEYTEGVDVDGITTRHVRVLLPDRDGHPRAFDRPLAESIIEAFTKAGIRGARLEPAHPDADASMFEE